MAFAVATVGCEVFGFSRPAAEACAGPAREYSGPVVGAFETTVGAIRGLDPLVVAPVRWPDLAAGHPAVLCYIDGLVPKAPPPINGVSRPFDRAIVAVVDGHAELVMAGYRDRFPIKAP